MKKLLALVLALVMTLGLATVGANAAYSDASAINEDFSEAIDVMSMIGVFDGQDGKFNPTGTLTREQGAKIITYMLLGKTGGDALTAGSAPYTDVAADRWSAGSIAYCTSEGIIGGVGGGKFDPESPLTGYAFAKMLLCALGYDAKIEGFNTAEWQINASKLAVTAGLNDKLENLAFGAALTREKAAQMAFNTEVANMVYYATKGTEITTSDGTNIVVGASAAEYKTNAASGTNNTLGNPATTQFGEVYTTKLNADAATTQNGLVGHTYSFSGKTSAWQANGSILATNIKGTSLAKLTDNSDSNYIGYKLDTDGATMNIVDGGTKSFAVSTVLGTVTGQLTGDAAYHQKRGVQIIFQDADGDNMYDNIAVIMDTLGKLTAAPSTKTSGEVTYVTVPGIAGLMGGDVKASNVFGYEGLAKGDYVLYHTDGTRWYLTKCESVTGTVTAFNAGSSNITVDGTAIKMSQVKGVSDTPASIYNATKGDAGTTVYKDLGGFVVKAVAAETSVDLSSTLYVISKADAGYAEQAQILKADGTSAIVTVAKVDSNTITKDSNLSLSPEKFYTYSVNSDGTYALKTIAASDATQNALTAADEAGNNNAIGSWDGTAPTWSSVTGTGDKLYTISKGKANFLTTWTGTGAGTNDGGKKNGVLANANTAFVIGNYNATGVSSKFTLYTGINNVPNTAAFRANGTTAQDSKIAYLVQDGYATFVVAYNSYLDNTSTSASYAFITGSGTTNYDADKKENYTVYPAVVDGEITTLEAVATPNFTSGNMTAGHLYAITAYDGSRASTLDSKGGQINQFTDGRKTVLDNQGTYRRLTSIDNIKISGGTVSFVDNGVTVDSGTVNSSTKYFFNDRTVATPTITEVDADYVTGLTGADYAVYAVRTSASDSTFKAVYVTATASSDVRLTVKASGTVTGPVAATALISAVDPSTADTAQINWTANTPTAIATASAATDTNAYLAVYDVTLTFTVDPNATIKVLTNTTGIAPAAADLVANAGSLTIAGATDRADTYVYVGVTNNGTTNYYKITLNCDN